MPWTIDRPPTAMRNLSPPVLRKAVEIANALWSGGMDEVLAIRVAIAQAHKWARRRGLEA